MTINYVFRPDQVTVPLSFRRQHSLPHPLIVVLDSLNWQRTGEVARIRAFLAAEWEVKERRKYPGIEPDFSAEGLEVLRPPLLPQQPNGYDCGVYVMEFEERTMKRWVIGSLHRWLL